MQSNLNRESIKRCAGRFTEADAFRVVRKHSSKARQLSIKARRALKGAALAIMFATGANAADVERAPLPPIPAALFDHAGLSKAKFCGNMWKDEKAHLSAAGHSWRTYSAACFAALKDKKAPARAKVATAPGAGAFCTTDSDCEAKSGAAVSLAPVSSK